MDDDEEDDEDRLFLCSLRDGEPADEVAEEAGGGASPEIRSWSGAGESFFPARPN